MRSIALIPARLASSRFPNKPLHKILGQELILHVCNLASRCKNINEIFVVTPDREIADCVFRAGYGSILTSEYPSCTHRVAAAVKTLSDNYDLIVNIQGDEPCIDPFLIDGMIQAAAEQKLDMVQAVYPLVQEDIADPNCVKAIINNNQIIGLTRRPELITTNLVGIAGVYVYSYNTIVNFDRYDQTLVEAWKGLDTFAFIGAVPVSPFMFPKRTPAVDNPDDILKVEHEISNRH